MGDLNPKARNKVRSFLEHLEWSIVLLVCHTAVFSAVTQRSSPQREERADTKNGSLRKHPFLLALRSWGETYVFAGYKNGCKGDYKSLLANEIL